MTGMLASVTNVTEAEIVLEAGVDIVDIKNPREGALGALEFGGVCEIVRRVNNVTPTSATIGDVYADDPALLRYIVDMAETGVDYVKVGLFDTQATEHFINTINDVSKDIRLVIVLFAENYSSIDSIDVLLRSNITGIMLDTKNKTGKSLRSILDDQVLKKFVTSAKKHNLLTGLAGSLRLDDIQPLLRLNPDYLGFRGALCAGNNRVKTIHEEQVKKIRTTVSFSKFINYGDSQYVEANI